MKEKKKNVRKLIIRKKRMYVIDKLEENRMVPRKFWKEIQITYSLVTLNRMLLIYKFAICIFSLYHKLLVKILLYCLVYANKYYIYYI